MEWGGLKELSCPPNVNSSFQPYMNPVLLPTPNPYTTTLLLPFSVLILPLSAPILLIPSTHTLLQAHVLNIPTPHTFSTSHLKLHPSHPQPCPTANLPIHTPLLVPTHSFPFTFPLQPKPYTTNSSPTTPAYFLTLPFLSCPEPSHLTLPLHSHPSHRHSTIFTSLNL